MAVATVTVSISDVDFTQNNQIVRGTLAVSASPDTYSTGGLTVDFSGFDQIKSSQPPRRVLVSSQKLAASPATTARQYLLNPGTTIKNGKLQVFRSGGFTPAGTVAAPTINTVDDSGTPTKALGELSGALSSNGPLTGLTGVQAPAFTGTAVAAADLTELAASSIPAGVSGDVIFFEAIFPANV